MQSLTRCWCPACGELWFVAEMLRAVSSCLQLLIDKTDVCSGQAQEVGGGRKVPQSLQAQRLVTQNQAFTSSSAIPFLGGREKVSDSCGQNEQCPTDGQWKWVDHDGGCQPTRMGPSWHHPLLIHLGWLTYLSEESKEASAS